MTGRAIPTRTGASLVDAVAGVLADLRDDPLAPATVVCSGSLEAVLLRRALGRRRGVAGVEFTTAEAVAERLARPALAAAGHWVASATEVRLALRAELAGTTGPLASVAHHDATVDQLYRLHRELAGVSPLALTRLERVGGLGSDAVSVVVAAHERLGPAKVERDVAALAELALELDPDRLGPIVLVGYEPSSPFQARVAKALTGAGATTVRPLTGHRPTDRATEERIRSWSLPPAGEPGVDGREPVVRRLRVADPDDEVAAAVRLIGQWAASGVPTDRLAVLVPPGSDLAPVVAERLAAAGLDVGGPGARPLTRSVAGRTLLRLLDIAEFDLDRAGLFTLLGGAPVHLDGQVPPAARWDRWSREAGVVDPDDWRPRLEVLAAAVAERDPAQADAVLAMADTIDRFRRGLGHGDDVVEPQDWPGWAAWAIGRLDAHVPAGDDWPDAEIAARDMIVERLDLTRRLGRLVERPGLADLRTVVAGFLDAAVVPGGRTGRGVLVAPVDQVATLDVDRLAIVGLADGLLPRRSPAVGLLSNQHRAVAAAELPMPNVTADRDLAAVMAAATSADEAVLLTSEGDLRGGRTRVWPVALDAVLTAEGVDLASHRAGLAEHGRPATRRDVELRSLIHHVDRAEPLDSHPLLATDPVLHRGLRWVRGRESGRLTGVTGGIGRGRVRLDGRVSSPTALEDYATCPRRYLFSRLFRLSELDRPERIMEISARERGSLGHAVLERFVGDRIDAGNVPAPDEPWDEAARADLARIVADEVEQRRRLGLTGGTVRTELLRRRQLAEAGQFVRDDSEHRAATAARPAAVELQFGMEGPASEIDLGDGRMLRFRGFIDRVDRLDGDGVMVIDYKSGSPRSYTLAPDDRLAGGRRLQLPIYAAAAADRLGTTGARRARYWFTSRGGHVDVVVDDDLEAELIEALRIIADGVAAGAFPARPGAATAWPRATFEHCKYCDFDRICPTDRHGEAERLEPVLVTLAPRPPGIADDASEPMSGGTDG